MQPEPIPVVRSRPCVGLSQLAIDEDPVSLRPKSREKKFSFFLNSDLMKLALADGKLVSFGKPERKHAKVFDQRLAVNPDFQIAGELIEREVDLVLLLGADLKAELHQISSLLHLPTTTITNDPGFCVRVGRPPAWAGGPSTISAAGRKTFFGFGSKAMVLALGCVLTGPTSS